ncbi:hypothetical protein MUN77_08480 [Leucobacter allii]|uniref:hypothetical protein n=1 Tax=Leucobacter allii TaxID=2932247 RepID=UPI001FD1DF08|nr:hypothetical protein [Leucobacter allii]UOR03301.1 hypothetical protein MUN77_08480 [Leucobacter allii]
MREIPAAGSEPSELDLLRELRADPGELEADRFALGLARLERDIAAGAGGRARGGASTRPGARRAPAGRARGRRRALVLGAGVLAVGAVAGVVLVATPAPLLQPVLGPAAPQDPHAEAVALLQRAADAALSAEPEVLPGQYLKVSCRTTGLAFPNSEAFLFEGKSPEAWMRHSTNQVNYVPPRATDLQVTRVSPDYDTEVVAGDFPEAAGAAEAVPYDGEQASAPGEYFETRLPAEALSGGFLMPDEPSELEEVALRMWEELKIDEFEYTPQQELPNALIPYLRHTMPQEIRAEAFRLLSEQPGVRLQAYAGDDARIGASDTDAKVVTFSPVQGVEIQLIFDVQRARMLGSQEVLTSEDPTKPGVAVGEVLSAAACSTSIVDEIPDIETWR